MVSFYVPLYHVNKRHFSYIISRNQANSNLNRKSLDASLMRKVSGKSGLDLLREILEESRLFSLPHKLLLILENSKKNEVSIDCGSLTKRQGTITLNFAHNAPTPNKSLEKLPCVAAPQPHGALGSVE